MTELRGDESPRATLRPVNDPGTLSGGDTAPPDGASDAGAAETIDSREFEVEGEVGRGGMGVIFRARQRSLDRHVAVKTLHPSLAGGPSAAKFAAEALVTGRLEHPCIPPV